MATEYRCKSCRKLIYPPPGSTGRIEVHCSKCGRRQDVEMPAETSR